MAFTINPAFQGFSGSIKGHFVFKQYFGKTVICNFPDRSRVIYSIRQKEEQDRFKNAVSFARVVISHTVLRESYTVKARDLNFRSAWQAAIADFMSKTELKPKVKKVRFDKRLITGMSGNKIRVNLFRPYTLEDGAVNLTRENAVQQLKPPKKDGKQDLVPAKQDKQPHGLCLTME